jgi:hypothetical protein
MKVAVKKRVNITLPVLCRHVACILIRHIIRRSIYESTFELKRTFIRKYGKTETLIFDITEWKY